MPIRTDSDAARRELQERRRRMQDLSPVMPEIGQIHLASVQKNFRVGGRTGSNPFGGGSAHWIPSGRAKRQSGKTLIDSGQLSASITYQIAGNRVIIGTNKVYGGIHQYGGVIKHPGGTPYTVIDGRAVFVSKGADHIVGYTKPHPITIPARPYIVVQDEDVIDDGDAVIGFWSDVLTGRR